ncbi:MAG: hypothetical protein AAGA48_00010 [Myxococcota bacterium]
MLNSLIAGHSFAIAALAARRIWVHVLQPNTIQGSDLFMLRWARRNGVRAYSAFAVSFGTTDDAVFDDVVRQLRANLAQQLTDTRSSWRRGVDVDRGRWVWRTDVTVDTLVDEVDTDEAFYAVSDPQQRDIVVRIHRGRRQFGVLFDHTCWDGIRVVNECLAPTITAKPFSSKWLLKDRFRPLLDELAVIATAYRLGWRALTYRTLPAGGPDDRQTVVKHRWRTADIKALKDRLNVPFSAAIVAMYGKKVLQWLPPHRKRVRIGVIVGLQSKRFRNNYSMVAVDVHRGDDLDTAARRVHRQMRRRRLDVVGLYHLANTIEVESFFKGQVVDALFSPAFFEPDTGLSQSVDDMSFFNVPSSTPLYSFACSIGDTITVCTTANSPALDLARMTEDAMEAFDFDAQGQFVEPRPVAPPRKFATCETQIE